MHILHKYNVTRVFSKYPDLMKKINWKSIVNVFTTVEDFRGFPIPYQISIQYSK